MERPILLLIFLFFFSSFSPSLFLSHTHSLLSTYLFFFFHSTNLSFQYCHWIIVSQHIDNEILSRINNRGIELPVSKYMSLWMGRWQNYSAHVRGRSCFFGFQVVHFGLGQGLGLSRGAHSHLSAKLLTDLKQSIPIPLFLIISLNESA